MWSFLIFHHFLHYVNPESMQRLTDTLVRRWKIGSRPWVSLADKHIAAKQVAVQESEGVDSPQGSSLADRLLCELMVLRDDWGVDWLALVLETSRQGILSNAVTVLGELVVLSETTELLCLGLA